MKSAKVILLVTLASAALAQVNVGEQTAPLIHVTPR